MHSAFSLAHVSQGSVIGILKKGHPLLGAVLVLMDFMGSGYHLYTFLFQLINCRNNVCNCKIENGFLGVESLCLIEQQPGAVTVKKSHAAIGIKVRQLEDQFVPVFRDFNVPDCSGDLTDVLNSSGSVHIVFAILGWMQLQVSGLLSIGLQRFLVRQAGFIQYISNVVLDSVNANIHACRDDSIGQAVTNSM